MSQPLHARINGHRSDITHQRTDVSPVAEHFNSGAHAVTYMTVMVIVRHVSAKGEGGQVDQNPGNFVPFRNNSPG